MYRVRVTTLEKFRRYMCSASPFDTEDALIESIRGIFMGNDKTKVGGAFHKLIEGDYAVVPATSSFKDVRYFADGIVFTHEQAAPAFAHAMAHPKMVCEVPVKKVFAVPGFGNIVVSGGIDGIEGRQVRDTKTKFRALDMSEYTDSLQWKCYLEMLGVDDFYYDLFEVIHFDALNGKEPYHVPGTVFEPVVTLNCIRYAEMRHDVVSGIQGFMEYIENRNFFHLLKQENETAIF